ncbi:MAG: protein-glutamate O-methyltransferase family protein [Anaerolineae bacterium]|nr:protein-glutamate O-methyltransferase family protein [Anaerolineae bacterium]
MTSEPGSFARATICERKPAIIAEVIDRSPKSSVIRPALEALTREIEQLPIAPPPDDAPLRECWEAEYRQWEGRTWLEVPWYFAESYFYVRLLSAVGYYRGDHPDPFATQKADLLTRCTALLPALADTAERVACLPSGEAFAVLARRSLWGNRIDLSNLAVAERHADEHHRLEDLAPVVDDCARAFTLVQCSGRSTVVVLCDNSGPELLGDLQLVDWLLTGGIEQVGLEVKPHPFFVSDATAREVADSLAFLRAAPSGAVSEMGQRLSEAVSDGRLVVRDHPYWCGPGHFRHLPAELEARLSDSCLVISKGDVNYRRFLEDRHWPFHTPIEQAVDYFPVPVLLLRTFKGELAAGLTKETVGQLAAADGNWLISGRQGVAQLVLPAHS